MINFAGSTDARARERVQARLLDQIKEAIAKEMPEDELGDRYPLSLPQQTLHYCSDRSGPGKENLRLWLSYGG